MDNRGKSPRRRALKRAKFAFNGGTPVIDCTVRDLSEGGAHACVSNVSSASPSVSPSFVEVDGAQWECRVVWRTRNEIGAAF